jgi:nicotinate-nucleotide adenylyltransferase
VKQVIIYGGSFNPLHKGHEAIIKHCLSFAGFDEVWIMPSAKRTDKPDLLDDAVRLEMLQIYVNNSDVGAKRLRVSDFETRLGAPSETIRTYDALTKAYPSTEFTFVFGADSIADMPNWRRGEYLEEVMNIIAVERFGSNIACDPLKHLCAYIPEDVSGLSSTLVRESVRRGLSIEQQVPQSISAFISRNNLYSA